jgi:hypothetical protein
MINSEDFNFRSIKLADPASKDKKNKPYKYNPKKIQAIKKKVAKVLTENNLAFDKNKIALVGSLFITGETTTDVDILVYVSAVIKDSQVQPVKMQEIDLYDDSEDWQLGGSFIHKEQSWSSWKKVFQDCLVNLILCNDETLFDNFVKAAEVCRYLHLSGIRIDKRTRLGVHSIIKDRSNADTEFSKVQEEKQLELQKVAEKLIQEAIDATLE